MQKSAFLDQVLQVKLQLTKCAEKNPGSDMEQEAN